MNAEIAFNQPDPDYRREPGENQSYLKHIIKSPAHYKAAKSKRWPPTTNMLIGSALHCSVLEGDEQLGFRFIKKPEDISFTTKEGRAWKLENKNLSVLSKTDFRNVLGMTESLRKLDWFDNKQDNYRKYNELSIYWDASGIRCKGRLDRAVIEDDEVLVLDLKTTDSVNPFDFQKKVAGPMNYIFQAAWYAEAAMKAFDKPARFIFVAIEREEPWSIGIFEMSKDMMEEGYMQINKAREILKTSLQDRSWPGPEPVYNIIDIPSWYRPPSWEDSRNIDLF